MDMALRTVKVNQNMLPIPNNYMPHTGTSPNVASIIHSKRPIAPAIDKNQTYINVNNANLNSAIMHNDGKCGKRKYNYGVPYSNQQTVSVVRRNARERNRVKQVNNGFANLRQHIPPKVITQLTNGGRGANKKLSKVDTLRLAVDYIKSLQKLLDDSERGAKHSMDGYYSTERAVNSPVSPSPSYISESSTSGTTYSRQGAQFKIEPFDQYEHSDSSSQYSPHETSYSKNPFASSAPQFKHEGYEEFEPSINPEDEELLDTITWWQQQ